MEKVAKAVGVGAETYRKAKRAAEQAVDSATALRVDALALMGEFLKATEKNQGASAGGKKESSRGAFLEPRDSTPTLAQVGITKKESSDAQALADIRDTRHLPACRQIATSATGFTHTGRTTSRPCQSGGKRSGAIVGDSGER